MALTGPIGAAVGVFVLYLVVVGLLWRLNGVDYPSLAMSARSVRRGLVVPIGVGLVGLVAATTVLGWWPDVLVQERVGDTWMLVVPILWLLAALVSCLGVDYRALEARHLLLLAVGCLFVGMAEELLSRGLLVVGAQTAGWSLVGVWLFSSVLFGLLHALNALFGLPWQATVSQVVMAFLGGTALFVTLMVTGSLLVGVFIHALWDFGSLANAATDGSSPNVAGLVLVAVYLVGLGAAWAMVT